MSFEPILNCDRKTDLNIELNKVLLNIVTTFEYCFARSMENIKLFRDCNKGNK